MHVAHEGKAFDARHERAQSVGKHLGQHRHDAVREIDRGGAGARFAIQCAANRT